MTTVNVGSQRYWRQITNAFTFTVTIFFTPPSLEEIAFRILSREHLVEVSKDATLKFSERYKKDPSRYISDFNPQRAILLDDQVNFALPPLKVLPALGRLSFTSKFDAASVGQPWFPRSREEHIRERQKALYWLSILDSALTLMHEKPISLSDAIVEVWGGPMNGDLEMLNSVQTDRLEKTGRDLVKHQIRSRSCLALF